jgi:hypothetical protein
MDEMCKGANQAVAVFVVLMAVLGAGHAIAVSAALVIWAIDKWLKRGD